MVRGEQKLLRLQRRLWLAQLALYPTAVLGAVGALVVAWRLWQRKSAARHLQATQPYAAAPSASPAADQVAERTT